MGPSKVEKRRAVDPAAVQRAIESALTKFDAMESTFAAHGKAGLETLMSRIGAEVLGDPELTREFDEERRVEAVRQVTSDVSRVVGRAYGAWVKGCAGAAPSG